MCVFVLFSEIARVRASLFQINGVKKEPLVLPEPEGPVTTLTEKVYVPVKEHPDVSNLIKNLFWECLLKKILLLQFNFVGRILGPRGMTAKQLEQETGCKIMVRGKGSMRDKKKVCVMYFSMNFFRLGVGSLKSTITTAIVCFSTPHYYICNPILTTI